MGERAGPCYGPYSCFSMLNFISRQCWCWNDVYWSSAHNSYGVIIFTPSFLPPDHEEQCRLLHLQLPLPTTVLQEMMNWSPHLLPNSLLRRKLAHEFDFLYVSTDKFLSNGYKLKIFVENLRMSEDIFYGNEYLSLETSFLLSLKTFEIIMVGIDKHCEFKKEWISNCIKNSSNGKFKGINCI